MSNLLPHSPEESLTSQLRQEYNDAQDLLNAQPGIVQRFLQGQAAIIASALIDRPAQARFTLPDRVVLHAGQQDARAVPAEQREQLMGGLIERLTRSDIRNALRQRLAELENAANPAVAASAHLIRHSTAMYMVHSLLPAGRTVQYSAAEGEEIPSLPIELLSEKGSAITAASDAIAEEGNEALRTADAERGELLVPFVPAARRFFLPQWVAFDDEDRLLVGSVSEAEGHIISMQRFLNVLHTVSGLAPYMTVDDVYQQKRYGMLGQLVNQGRALARYQTQEIIHTIQLRVKNHELNRGLSLSLPYFNDQALQMEVHAFEVIPAGRIMFVPAFVVRAAREEVAKVAQDTRLSPSTRKHLLAELDALETAFDRSDK